MTVDAQLARLDRIDQGLDTLDEFRKEHQAWLEDLARRLKTMGNGLIEQGSNARMRRQDVRATGRHLHAIADEIQLKARAL